MHYLRPILTLAFSLLISAGLLSAVTPPDGFTVLFNGENLEGWHGNNPHQTLKATNPEAGIASQQASFAQNWSVKDGTLFNTGKGPYATTDEAYGDFELWIDFKVTPNADSGIYLRGTPQVQVWDTTSKANWVHGAKLGSGGLWNNGKGEPGRDPLVHADNAVGQWNHMRIRMIGSRTWVALNGEVVVDSVPLPNYWTRGKTPLPARGPIHLQTHGAPMYWRNVFIREIGAKEAEKLLSEMN